MIFLLFIFIPIIEIVIFIAVGSNIGRLAYLQANVLVGYVLLAPAIVAGVMTLGVMQQILRAFGRVEGSLQYLFKAWPTIIELASVYRRLREFEYKINKSIKESELDQTT